MTIQRQTNTTHGRYDLSRESALDWTARRIQAELAAMPEQKRAEAIALARQRALEKPGSYLSKYFERLYGVKG